MYNILLVGDNREIQEANKGILTQCGAYSVSLAGNLAEARERLAGAEPDVIVLDIMLPDGGGFDFLEKLRRDTDIPVLLLADPAESSDAVKDLRAGGDDYLAKPYENAELPAHIESLLSRTSRPPKTLVKGRLTLNMISGTAFIDGRNLLLSHKEFAVLLLLARNEGKTVSPEYLYKEAWGLPLLNKQTLKNRISELRKKLENAKSGYEIANMRGKGYCFMRKEKR